jgi:uncharacterized glyoxalase superfamily protein PhnB
MTNQQQPAVMHAEPVLAVNDVLKAVDYWHDVLGFTNKWTWGQPPNHGGVSWQGTAFIQFSLNLELALAPKTLSIWFRVRQLESLYSLHQRNNATIVVPLTNRPWGMAEYIVQDINGYYVTFSAPVAERVGTTDKILDDIKIVERAPTFTELKKLMLAVGWAAPEHESSLQTQLQSTVFTVVAENATGEAVACAFLLGDSKSIYYVKDVIVHPNFQGKGIGTKLMERIDSWIHVHAPHNATVGLFTGDHLAGFYRQFGFTQACGMYKQIKR